MAPYRARDRRNPRQLINDRLLQILSNPAANIDSPLYRLALARQREAANHQGPGRPRNPFYNVPNRPRIQDIGDPNNVYVEEEDQFYETVTHDLAFQHLNDAQFYELFQRGGVQGPVDVVPNRRNRNISERDVTENEPASEYVRTIRYRLRPPLSENLELAIPQLYYRMRDNPYFTPQVVARIRIVRNNSVEQLVRNPYTRYSRIFDSFRQLRSEEGYNAFRDTLMLLFTSNDDIDLSNVEFFLEFKPRQFNQGGAGNEADVPLQIIEIPKKIQGYLKSKWEYLKQKGETWLKEPNEQLRLHEGLLLIPHQNHNELCGWLVITYFLIVLFHS